jgi:hypothetical protein
VDAVTSLVEIGVGIACMLGGVATLRRHRWPGVALAILGAVAITHGILALAAVVTGNSA